MNSADYFEQNADNSYHGCSSLTLPLVLLSRRSWPTLGWSVDSPVHLKPIFSTANLYAPTNSTVKSSRA